jgi:chloramphenicol-sensitive protein RarD
VSGTRLAERQGLLYGFLAYGTWGLVPFYFKAIASVSPAEVLAHRIVWSVVFLFLLVCLVRRWPDVVRGFRVRSLRRRLTATAVLIALNWLVYIYSVSSKQLVQSSLGYFITPLVNVLLGMLFLGERLRPGQWAAVGLAVVGVLNLVLLGGRFPWLALTLAGSFGMYGLLRKQAAVDGMTGLAVETTILMPAAVGYLVWLAWTEELALGSSGLQLDTLLMLSGVVTTIPLICFGQAARRLRLSTLGFLQYLSPSVQLVLAVFVFDEEMSQARIVSFGFIWVALAVYSLEAVLPGRPAPHPEPVPLVQTSPETP